MHEQNKLMFSNNRVKELLSKKFTKELQIDTYAPTFYTLNKSLQEELIQVLYKLGVTSEINNYTRYLGLNRERREYVAWLFKIMKVLNMEDFENIENKMSESNYETSRENKENLS
jgi:hypothetical protein